MATYYQWRKSTISYSETSDAITTTTPIPISNTQTFYREWTKPQFVKKGYDLSDAERLTVNGASVSQTFINAYVAGSTNPTEIYTTGESTTVVNLYNNTACILPKNSGGTIYVTKYTAKVTAGSFVEYVYSTSPSAYPNGGISGDYYYDSRTLVPSPTQPSGLTYPATITTPSVTVSWTASASLVPSYSVNLYEVSYSTNGGTSWTVAGTTSSTSYSFSIPAGTTSIMFRVRARDSNKQYGAYTTGTVSQVAQTPTLSVPEMVMQGQSATVSWSEVEGADSYILQRKSSADTDWTQVYSGTALTFTETAGTWTSLQYRVQAVFDGTGGGWATSDSIQIVSASALVISGSDGDLGTITSDVSYSVSSDQTSPVIEVTVTVNGGEYAAFQAVSGQNYRIGVLDLPTGTGSIVITASTTVSASPVTVTRTWTYTKAAQSFPAAGSVARLTQEGDTIWPQTLAEAVRTTGGPWGGDLSKALNLLQGAAVYHRTSVPKYSEVSIDLSTVQAGNIIQLPENGAMVEFYVASTDYEPTLNTSGTRVLLVRKDTYDDRVWDSGNVNAYASSDLDSWFNSTYKNMLDADIRSLIGTTKIRYTPGNGNWTVGTLERAIFALSLTELGYSHTYANTEGSALPIASTLRIAYRNGSATTQWTRSPHTGNTTGAWRLGSNGNFGNVNCSSSYGSRPAFTLPSTLSATYYVDTHGNVYPSQEYTTAGDFSDLWGNIIPTVKIETGSYVGTGTYGQSNPNTLNFSFEPLLVIIVNNETSSSSSTNVQRGFFINGMTRTNTYISTSQSVSARIIWDGNTIKWYADSSPNAQLNVSNSNYYYIALG